MITKSRHARTRDQTAFDLGQEPRRGLPSIVRRSLVPLQIELRRDKLLYNPRQYEFRRLPEQTDLFGQFIQLADDESGHAILNFARKYGVLGLDSDGLPLDARWLITSFRDENTQYELAGSEPLRTWRNLACRFGALRRIAGYLHMGKTGLEADWLAAIGERIKSTQIKRQKAVFEFICFELVQHSNLRPTLSWTSHDTEFEPRIEYSIVWDTGLFDSLLLKLLLTVCRKEGWAHCGVCHIAFVPSKYARRGTVRYCPKCKTAGLANADAASRSRRNRTKSK